MGRARAGAVVAAVAAAGLLAGCAAERSAAEAPEVAARPVPRPAVPAVAPVRAVPEAVPEGFAVWRDGFRAKALARGIRAEVFDRAFAGVTPDPLVVERDRYQPEFRRQIWEYLERAVSPARIRIGREKWAEHGALLRAIEARHGVDQRIVLAIWGLESSYGANLGDMDVIRSLATLAHDGRRRDFAETQLLTALAILQAGDVAPGRMTGSWAGAMGHTQFIPTSFVAHAVDWDGDGRRDIWGPDPADALASTANYLAEAGWRPGLPWGMEVRLPAGFDAGLAGGEVWRPVADWAAAGVTLPDGRVLPALGELALVAPAGVRGPVFAITRNFMVLRRYNNAFSYALAVGHLADRIGGGGPFAAAWPAAEAMLSPAEISALQARLTLLGHDTGGTDGLIGPRTLAAIRDYQRAAGLAVDGFPTRALYDRVMRPAGG